MCIYSHILAFIHTPYKHTVCETVEEAVENQIFFLSYIMYVVFVVFEIFFGVSYESR